MDSTHLFDTTDWRSLVKLRLKERGEMQQTLADRIGRSGGWLSQVLSGKRPMDLSLAPQIADALALDAETTEYFTALVDLENESLRARRAAFAAVQSKQRQRASPELKREAAVALSRWYVQAILELASCEGFRMDPAWIAAILSPPVREDDAREALTALVRLGFLAVDERGQVVGTSSVISPSVLPKGERSTLAVELHRSMMQLASDALSTTRDRERHIGSLVMALSDDQLERIKAKLRLCEQEIALIATEDPGPKDRVYQLQFQLFPVTLYTDIVLPGEIPED